MKRDFMKMFVLIALWAVVGAITGHEVAQGTSFWVGVLIGGVVGFIAGVLTWDLRQTAAAIKNAWRAVKLKPEAPDWKQLKDVSILMSGVLAVASSVICYLFVVPVYIWSNKGDLAMGLPPYLFVGAVFLVAGGAMVFLLSFALYVDKRSMSDADKKIAHYCVKHWNPISAPFSLAYFVCCGVLPFLFRLSVALVRTAPVVFHGLLKFFKLVAVFVYSDDALVCGTFAAFGVMTGYVWFDRVILWAGVAGAFGVVSKKLLGARVVTWAKA